MTGGQDGGSGKERDESDAKAEGYSSIAKLDAAEGNADLRDQTPSIDLRAPSLVEHNANTVHSSAATTTDALIGQEGTVSDDARAPTASPSHTASNDGAGLQTEVSWSLKPVSFPPLAEFPSELRVLVQDANGPCSFLALCNILILRGNIALPPDQPRATYTQLASLVADHMLRRSSSPSSPTVPTNALDFALSILPKTLSGLDVNVDFISGDFSRPAGSAPGELELFALAGVPIKHGWLASQDDAETFEILQSRARDYDSAATFVAEADSLAKGAVTGSGGVEAGELSAALEQLSLASEEEQLKVQQGALVHRFLQSSSTQLTYSGLFGLSESLQPGSLTALFRNAHFSVLLRHPDPQKGLLSLVTDDALAGSPECVWESLADTDGAASAFFDSHLRPARVRQDWVGCTSEDARPREKTAEQLQAEEADEQLARQLQEEDRAEREQRRRNYLIEEEERRRRYLLEEEERRRRAGDKEEARRRATTAAAGAKDKKEKKEKKDCIVC